MREMEATSPGRLSVRPRLRDGHDNRGALCMEHIAHCALQPEEGTFRQVHGCHMSLIQVVRASSLPLYTKVQVGRRPVENKVTPVNLYKAVLEGQLPSAPVALDLRHPPRILSRLPPPLA